MGTQTNKRREYPDRLRKLDNSFIDKPNKGIKKKELKVNVRVTPDEERIIKANKVQIKALGIKGLTTTEILRRMLLKLANKKILEELDFKILKRY